MLKTVCCNFFASIFEKPRFDFHFALGEEKFQSVRRLFSYYLCVQPLAARSQFLSCRVLTRFSELHSMLLSRTVKVSLSNTSNNFAY